MKLIVFCNNTYQKSLPRFKQLFDSMLIEPHFFCVDKNWELSRERSLLTSLHRGDELLIIGDRHCLSDPWMIFLLGFLRGQQESYKRLVFFLFGNTRKLPFWLKEFPIVKTMDNLLRIWRQNESDWMVRTDQEIASKRILDMGYYLTTSDFFLAVEEGDLFLFSLYLEAGFDPDVEDKEGVPILCHVIRQGYSLFLPRLIHRGVNVNCIAHDRANTPIMEAASKGLNDVLHLLVENGAELDHKSKSGQTALILAVGNGQIESAKYLLESGASIDAKDELGMSAEKYAKLYGYQDLVDQIERMESE